MHSTLKNIQSDAIIVPDRRTTISSTIHSFGARRENLKALLYAVGALAVFFWLKEPLHAEEGGAGDYIPGLYASVVNITPNQPGLALGSAFLFYTGSAGGSTTLPFGGLLAANINADVYLTDVSLAYTFKPTFLGAHYTAAVAVPYVWMDVEAKVALNPRLFRTVIGNRTKTVNDGANGLSDMFIIPAALNWTFGDLQINPQIFIVAPTGDYQKGQLANPGKNHWMFDTLLGVSYLSHKTGTEFTMFGGFAISTKNPDTDYRNGDVFHLEATLQQFLPLSKETLLGIGANGFYYQQVTGDSGSGAVLGPNEGTDAGVGPVLTLIHKASKYNFSAQVKWLPEIYTNNRLSGDWVWVSVGLQF
jgi:hypothetical protein